jgi:hypothetical protein
MLSVDPPGGSTEKVTESSGSLAKTFVASANAFLNGSAGLWLSCIKVTHLVFGNSLCKDHRKIQVYYPRT